MVQTQEGKSISFANFASFQESALSSDFDCESGYSLVPICPATSCYFYQLWLLLVVIDLFSLRKRGLQALVCIDPFHLLI